MIDVDAALAFLTQSPRSIDYAWGAYIAGKADRQAVLAALGEFQNADGGFGQHLEVDIAAPDSQPFAARLAMTVMLSTGIDSTTSVVQRLAEWLEREQSEDGCWLFPAGVYEHQLAPWFAGWEFPSLNPALDVAGFARRLGIGSPRLFERVANVARRMGKESDLLDGEFYDVLPYAEYVPWFPEVLPVSFFDALVAGIETRLRTGAYDDAGHAFDHIGPANGAVASRLPADLISAWLERLESEQTDDGGWPSPYDPTWRYWVTAASLAVLKDYGRLPG